MEKCEIIISNPKQFEEKRKRILMSGAKNLHLVTDFDKTLSKAFDKNKKIHTIIAQVREGKYLSEEYTKKAFELHAKYYPIEISHNISLKEKLPLMEKWWGTHINLLAANGMNKKIVKDIAKNKIILRKGTLELIKELNKKKIPLLILSAGLGDIIEEIFKFNNIKSKNTNTISNFFKFDKKGNVTGYKGKIIHSLNKEESEIKNTPYFKKIKNRKNIILLGDSLDDLKMIEGIHYNEIIKIGFLNDKIEENLELYKKAYDVIILNDGTMEFATKLIKEIN
ncbi:MAG: haloacid dehalogenase-like hydrolase [archaeon]|jgi:5'-nucleotidase